MLDRGVYLPPSQFEAWFPSLAHTDEHVERTLERGPRGARGAVSVLAEVVAAADPALRRTRVAEPGPGRFDGGRGRARRSCSRRSTRATSSTTASRARSRGMDDDLRLLAGRRALRAGPRAAGRARRPRGGGGAGRPDLALARAGRRPEGRAADAEALWEASAGAAGRDRLPAAHGGLVPSATMLTLERRRAEQSARHPWPNHPQVRPRSPATRRAAASPAPSRARPSPAAA